MLLLVLHHLLRSGRYLLLSGLLIRHYISRKDSLLSLFTLQLESCEGTYLVKIIATRRRVLARANSLVRLDVHASVHWVSSLHILGHFRTILAASGTLKLIRVNRR